LDNENLPGDRNVTRSAGTTPNYRNLSARPGGSGRRPSSEPNSSEGKGFGKEEQAPQQQKAQKEKEEKAQPLVGPAAQDCPKVILAVPCPISKRTAAFFI